MEVIHQRCAGMDISKSDAKVCIRIQGRGRRKTSCEVTTHVARSSSILALAQTLLEAQVTTVVMEATGDYWKPFFYLLQEAGLPVVLANPTQVRQIPRRKTDVADAIWLADLAAHGLVRGSFVPELTQRELKDLIRCRTNLTRLKGQEVQRLEKLLESAVIKLSSVISDINGVSGRRMLEALIQGERDPDTLAALGRGLQASRHDLAEALTGGFTDHHGFLARIHLDLIDYYQQQMHDLDRRIETYFTPTTPPQPPTPGQTQTLDWHQARDLLDTIPGISKTGAEQILAEIGIDMSIFPTPAHLASWAGVAPGINESAGKHHPVRCPPGDSYLKGALGNAAASAANTKNTFLQSRYQRIARRRGKKRAIVAISRSIITASWHILTTNQPYHDLGGDYHTKRRPGTAINSALERLRQAGLTITPNPDGILITQT